MSDYRPTQGDIVMLDFTSQAGHEQVGRRPALVVSNSSFQRYTGLAIFCPITNQIKDCYLKALAFLSLSWYNNPTMKSRRLGDVKSVYPHQGPEEYHGGVSALP